MCTCVLFTLTTSAFCTTVVVFVTNVLLVQVENMAKWRGAQ